MKLELKKCFKNELHKFSLTFESEDAGKTWFPGFKRSDLDSKNSIDGPLAEQLDDLELLKDKDYKTDNLTSRELLDLLELLSKFSESNIKLNQ